MRLYSLLIVLLLVPITLATSDEQNSKAMAAEKSSSDDRRLSFQCIGINDESMLVPDEIKTRRKSSVIEAPKPKRPAFLNRVTGDNTDYSEQLRLLEHRIADLEEQKQSKSS